jgi:DNA-3-methyladenine glycosylase
MKKLDRDFYSRPTVVVAEALLGCLLVHRMGDIERVGKIVEVEAYVGAHDLASHSSKGVTPRTRIMYGPPGHAYVYLIYGMHHCMNVVTELEGNGAAVLIRALEPVRNVDGNTRGPGLLCKAMGIDRTLDGRDLLGDVIFVSPPAAPVPHVTHRPRIGVAYAREWAGAPLRFYLTDNPFVSRK